MIDPGWKGVAKISEKKKDDPDDTALGDISSLYEGDEIKITQAGVKAGKTTPPKSYTDVIHFESRQWKYSKCKGAG